MPIGAAGALLPPNSELTVEQPDSSAAAASSTGVRRDGRDAPRRDGRGAPGRDGRAAALPVARMALAVLGVLVLMPLTLTSPAEWPVGPVPD